MNFVITKHFWFTNLLISTTIECMVQDKEENENVIDTDVQK